jgi:glutamate-1-semialdehyde 2,1-aminomutase
MTPPRAVHNLLTDDRQRRILDRYGERTPDSRRAHERAMRVLPGGVSRNIVHHAPYPLFIESGRGAHLVDVDGNDYLDFIGNHTAMILGNGAPEVTAAVESQLARGTAWAAASRAEAILAELIVDRLPSAEHVRFAASGTEAAMLAVRLARAFTGRSRVAKFEGGYHGLGEFAMISVAPDPAAAGPAAAPTSVAAGGVTPAARDDVVVLPFNDAAAVEAILQRHAAELAAIVVEPVMGVAGTIAPAKGFLDLLRRLAHRHGIVLVFDEVITLRLAYGGAQALFGVTPDLTVLGKIIGGGYPIGAIAGRAEIMALCDPTRPDAVLVSGTFHANPVALAAGAATLKLLTPETLARLNDRSGALMRQVAAILGRARTPLRLTSVGSLFNLHANDAPVTDYRSSAGGNKELLKWLRLALLNEGVMLSARGMGCLSVPMTDADLRRFTAALERALAAVGVLADNVPAAVAE